MLFVPDNSLNRKKIAEINRNIHTVWLLFEFNAQAAIVAPAQAPTVDIPNFRNLEAIFVSTCYWLELSVKKVAEISFVY